MVSHLGKWSLLGSSGQSQGRIEIQFVCSHCHQLHQIIRWFQYITDYQCWYSVWWHIPVQCKLHIDCYDLGNPTVADICQVLLPCSDSNQNSVLATHTVPMCQCVLYTWFATALSVKIKWRWSNWEFYLEMLSSVLELVPFSLSPTHAVVTAVMGRNMILGCCYMLGQRLLLKLCKSQFSSLSWLALSCH